MEDYEEACYFDAMYGDEMDLLLDQESHCDNSTIDQDALNQQTDVSMPPASEIDASAHSKRTIDELFDEIDRTLYGDEHVSKKPKKGDESELELQLALIEHIIELRKLNGEKFNHIHSTKNAPVKSFNTNITLTVPAYNFIPVTRYDGDRIYIRYHTESYEEDEISRIVRAQNTSILVKSNENMWTEARLLLNKSVSNTDIIVTSGNTMEPHCKQLWVDSYKPCSYVDLLSDESINRIMMKWINLWDHIVFKRRRTIRRSRAPMENEKFNNKPFHNIEVDERGLPQYKVALLCGPPGMGKTTLAHIVSRLAGYNVVEVNASDDKSPQQFKQLLDNCTQTHSVLEKSCKPTCIILDEIDGAPTASIDVLVKYVLDAKGDKKSKAIKRVNRPIICICNDLYVPALRSLRPHALILHFPPTSPMKLAERLVFITKLENVKTDLGAMLALVKKSRSDIRQCTSFIQMFKARKQCIDLSDVIGSAAKDMHLGLFDVWNAIFFYNSSLRDIFSNVKSRIEYTTNIIRAYGDYDKLASGVFENYIKLQQRDAPDTMNGINEALDWFVFHDLLQSYIATTQNYSLQSYIPPAFAAWNLEFCTLKRQKLIYPNTDFEVRTKLVRIKNIVTEYYNNLPPIIRFYVSQTSLILDIIPHLLHIIKPCFRPVNLHLFTDQEKCNLNEIVSTMLTYNINYILEKTQDGNTTYKLNPKLDEVGNFSNASGLHQKSQEQVSFSIKQIITSYLQKSNIKYEANDCVNLENKEIRDAPTIKNGNPKVYTKSATEELNIKRRPFVDFFKTNRQKSTGNTVTKKTHIHGCGDIVFQYKEGYSNAVCKYITMDKL